MDWESAVEHNRAALVRIVAALFAMAGLAEGAMAVTLPRYLRSAVLRILRPAESAARRLIVTVARGMEVTVRPAGQRKNDARRGASRPAADTAPGFLLIDPLKRFDFRPRRRYAKTFPRITCIGLSEPTPIPDDWFPSPDDEMNAAPVCRRLAALKRALDDLPGQAKRLARWRARRDLGLLRARRLSPLRPGWPPGHRKRPFHEVDAVLRECHSLAVYAMKAPDTS